METKTKLKAIIVSFVFLFLTFIAIKSFAMKPTYCYYVCNSGEILACEIEGCNQGSGWINCGGTILACH